MKGEKMIKRQTGFDRMLRNEAKMGAYYTDSDHAYRIGKLFEFEGETCLLEPSIGDATAVTAFVDGAGGENVKLFGVELNRDSYDLVKEKCDYCLCADFLEGVRIANKKFTVCFTNPPYGFCEVDGVVDRLERRFLEKIFNYLQPGGFLIAIISEPQWNDSKMQRTLTKFYEVKAAYRFDEKEYVKWKQVVVIATRKNGFGYSEKEMEEFRGILSSLTEIPDKVEEKYVVPSSKAEEIDLFQTVKFDPSIFSGAIRDHALDITIKDRVLIPEYKPLDIGHPPIPLKRDHLYLAATAGAGEGIAGSEKHRDLHLQRGDVRIVQHIASDGDEDGDEKQTSVRIRSSNQITMKIIDNCGHCIDLS